MHNYYVYILTNQHNKVMYVGVTSNLERRLQEHRMKVVPGFTDKYNVDKLVYFEETRDIVATLEREKRSRNGGGRRRMLWLSAPILIGRI